MIDWPQRAPFLTAANEQGRGASKKTLWLFGPAVSAQLGFPLEDGFLRSTVDTVMNTVGRVNEMALDIGRTSGEPAFRKADGSGLANFEVRSMKENPELAFDHLDVLEYFSADEGTRLRLQPLIDELGQLRERLAEVGIRPPTADLLRQSPRCLSRQIDGIVAADLLDDARRGRDDAAFDAARQAARICLDRLHVLALLEFQYRALSLIDEDWRHSPYEQLVRQGAFNSGARLLSFNCDASLDEALFRSYRGSWTYGGIEVAGINGLPSAACQNADLIFIKPHGSLNMFGCRSCAAMHIQWLRRFVPFGKDLPANVNWSCPRCRATGNNGGESLDASPLPTLYDTSQLSGAQESIEQAFSWAERIVSIGYEFPPEDVLSMSSMTAGLAANTHRHAEIWLLMGNQSQADGLRNRLLASAALDVVQHKRIALEAMAWSD